MEQHIFVTTLSTIRKDAQSKKYYAFEGDFAGECKYTNETGLSFVKYQLEKDNKELSHLFAFSTKEVKETKVVDEILRAANCENLAFTEVDLDDSTLEQAFSAMEVMYQCIRTHWKKDKGKNNKKKVHIHLDMTGGRRPAAIMMYGLIRLLQYSGYKIGYTIYTEFISGYVGSAKEILDIFNSMAAAEEFTRYGRVDGFSKLYGEGKNCSEELKQLLQAMTGVSDVLLWCGVQSEVSKSLGVMEKAIETYSKLKETNSSEILFKVLLPKIQSSYHQLLENKDNPKLILYVIRWCLDNKLIQQAVTFTVEWVPEYLFNSALLELCDEKCRKYCEDKVRDYQTLEVYFFRYYSPRGQNDAPRQDVMKECMDRKYIRLDHSMECKDFLNLARAYDVISKHRNRINHAANSKVDFSINQEYEKNVRSIINIIEKASKSMAKRQ